MLADLMRVRNLRKDRVERELQAARQHLEECKKAVTQREKELEDYKIFVEKETDRQYNNILKKKVRKGSVDDLRENIRILQARTVEYVQRVAEAKEEVRKAEDNIRTKQEQLIQANKDLEKLESHKKQWIEEQKKLEEFLSDMAMEEATRSPAKSPDEEPQVEEG